MLHRLAACGAVIVLALAFAPRVDAAATVPAATEYSYPAYWRANFMEACTGGGADPAICGCVLEGFEFSWPFWVAEEYDRTSATPEAQRTAPQNELNAAATRIILACVQNPNIY